MAILKRNPSTNSFTPPVVNKFFTMSFNTEEDLCDPQVSVNIPGMHDLTADQFAAALHAFFGLNIPSPKVYRWQEIHPKLNKCAEFIELSCDFGSSNNQDIIMKNVAAKTAHTNYSVPFYKGLELLHNLQSNDEYLFYKGRVNYEGVVKNEVIFLVKRPDDGPILGFYDIASIDPFVS
jgi:hypothetical protein